MAGGREFHEQKERDWSGVGQPKALKTQKTAKRATKG